MTIEEILAGESKNVEFKVQRPDKSVKYMKSVVAFANGKGGQIVFGVDDKTREVVGIPEDIVFQEIDAITNAISDSCEPTIIPEVTQNVLSSWGVLAEKDGAVVPTNAYKSRWTGKWCVYSSFWYNTSSRSGYVQRIVL